MFAYQRWILIAALACAPAACQKGEKSDSKQSAANEEEARKVADKIAEEGTQKMLENTRGPIKPPMDISAPPADAKKTPGGVTFVVMNPGKDDKKPGPNDTVLVNYTGWKPSGEMIFTTERRRQPQPMPIPQLPKGWSETLSDMTVGEKRMVWMPSSMAARRELPAGQPDETQVFQVEVMEIQAAPEVPPDVAAPPKDALQTKSGIYYKVLTPGTGTEKPRPWDRAMIHYTGWTSEGKMFDSTGIRNRPRPVIPFREPSGWAEAIELMVVGQKNRIWVKPEMVNRQATPPGPGLLVYDIELVELHKQNDPPAVPTDVAAPPKDAKKTAKGVFYKVLKKGTGTEHPTPDKTVKVHYTGWTTDGKMFDSSVVRGQPSQFRLDRVIPGWTDGMQLMVTGETTRFWIPEELAYKGQPNRPQGMLVFDVELMEVMKTPEAPARMPPGQGGMQAPGSKNVRVQMPEGAVKAPAAPQNPGAAKAPAQPTPPGQAKQPAETK